MFWGCEFLEKFGIFELLDTLSAILAGDNGPSAPQKPPAGQTADPTAARSAPAADSGQEAPPQDANPALSAFLARHDRVSKKIDGK